MHKLSVIVPIYNEAGNIKELSELIDKVLIQANIDYEIIFVNDRSKDSSEAEVNEVSAKNKKVILHNKIGKQGKAFSILEGAKIAKHDVLAMIDGDLQYPPEKLPEMYFMVKDTHGIVVANRRNHKTSLLRKIGSKINVFVFEKLLHGFNCDAQSGLKVFKKEIISHLDESEVGEWTLDMPLLHTALELGHSIGCVEIDFSERKNGESKVQFIKAATQIGSHALKLKFRKSKIYHLSPTDNDSMKGAGVAYKRQRYITHTTLPHHESAFHVLFSWQKYFLAALIIGIGISVFANAQLTAIVIVALLTFVYFVDFVFGLFVLMKSMHFPPEVSIGDDELKSLDDSQLPIYSILCPLYKEAQVLPQFLESLATIDYPTNKLDVLLLLEENDQETIDAAYALNLPKYVRVVVVPHSLPKTKPKACNYGLAHAKGEYVVIYDAEDKPDPLQLKKAAIAFNRLGNDVFCLQCKLNYYNPNHNILTRLFTAEYSLWFDLMLPGLQSINTTIPLGGTSNHFRTRELISVSGWDPFNVTEDCDLGVRIFKKGYKTAVIDSTTYEEANSHVGNWIRQRSRWIKGYFQTYLVHMRHPLKFFKSHKHQALIFQLVIGMRMFFILINPILWVTTISYFVLYRYVGPQIESLYPAPVFYMGVICLIFGNFMYLYNYMIGCAKREQWALMKYVFFVPVYWILTSIAAAMALWQLITKPHYWEKTRHGLHLNIIPKPKTDILVEQKIVETEKPLEPSNDLPGFGLDGVFMTLLIFADIAVSAVSLNQKDFTSFIQISSIGKIILFSGLVFIGVALPYFKKITQIENAKTNAFYLYFGMVTLVLSITSIGAYLVASEIIPEKIDLFAVYVSAQALIGLAIALGAFLNVTAKMPLWILGFVTTVLFVFTGYFIPQNLETYVLSVVVISYGYLFGIFMQYVASHTIKTIFKNIGYLISILAESTKTSHSKHGLRIVIFNWRDTKHVWSGGAEVYVHELAKRWVEMGHKVTLVCGNDTQNPSKEYIDGVKVVRRGGFYTVYLWAMIYYILRLRNNTDVIIESVNGVPFFSSIFAPSVTKFLLIHHVHQDVFRNHLAFPLSTIARFVEKTLMPYLYRNEKIVTISESSRNDILKLGLSYFDQIDIVNPSIDPSTYIKTKKTTNPSFVYLGRLKAYKNIDTAIRALALVVKNIPSATLSIVGFGEELQNLKNLAKELGVSKNVKFHGKVSEKMKAKILAKSWVLLQPSSVEGWGITVIEANASGTTVIASDVNGLKDSVVDGVTGVLVPVKNVDVLSSVMLGLASDKKLTDEFSKRAYQYSKQFSWDKSAQKFIHIVKSEFDRKKSVKYSIGNVAMEG